MLRTTSFLDRLHGPGAEQNFLSHHYHNFFFFFSASSLRVTFGVNAPQPMTGTHKSNVNNVSSSTVCDYCPQSNGDGALLPTPVTPVQQNAFFRPGADIKNSKSHASWVNTPRTAHIHSSQQFRLETLSHFWHGTEKTLFSALWGDVSGVDWQLWTCGGSQQEKTAHPPLTKRRGRSCS